MKDRQRARTDLLWLCNEVLQYPDVCADVHGPIIEKLQKFKGGTDEVNEESGALIKYTPESDVWELKGPRKRLFLDPRGHLKTTVITISHGLQWIINFPDIRLLLSMATGDQVQSVATELLNHFRFNERFRYLFPEFCPAAKSAKEFGNLEGFTVPCRKRKWMKEKTVTICTVGKVVAGGHYEVIKHSDLVDKENIRTAAQVQTVIDHFKYMNPLLERGPIEPFHGWTDVEGTRYDFGDLYGWILEKEEKLDPELRSWQVSQRSAYNDAGGTLWPKKFPPSELEAIKRDLGDDFIFSCQYLQNPIPKGSGLAVREQIVFMPRKQMMSQLRYLHMTLDLAGMEEGATGDYTVATVGGFDRDGRMNIVNMLCGRPNQFEVIEWIYGLCKLYRIQDIKMENAAHERVLRPFLKREQHKRGFLPPIVVLKRDNRTSKKQRITGLQPFFQGGSIRFAEEITCRIELQQQILRFSKTSTYHDDILDTLADQLQNRDGDDAIGDLVPDAPKGESEFGMPPQSRFLGFDPMSHDAVWSDRAPGYASHCHERTGL